MKSLLPYGWYLFDFSYLFGLSLLFSIDNHLFSGIKRPASYSHKIPVC